MSRTPMAFEREREPPGRRGDLQPAAKAEEVQPDVAGWPGKRTLTGKLSGRIFRSATGGGISPFARRYLQSASQRSGRPLPQALRERLARALGANLDGVRIHTGPEAALAARAIAAQAYTIGRDIYFAEGTFQESDPAAERLIAHEVAHTTQATGTPHGELSISRPDDAAEVAADRFADAFAQGRAAPTAAPPDRAPTAASIHRSPEPGQQMPEAAQSWWQRLTGQTDQPDLRQIMSRQFTVAGFAPQGKPPFDAEYNPRAGLLKITCRLHIEFRDAAPEEQPGTQPGAVQRWTRSEKDGWTERALARLNHLRSQPVRLHAVIAGQEIGLPPVGLPPVGVEIDIKLVEAARAHATITVDRPRARDFDALLAPYTIKKDEAAAVLASMTGIGPWEDAGSAAATEEDPKAALASNKARIGEIDKALARRQTIGQYGALHAERIDLSNKVASAEERSGVYPDCITFVMMVLGKAFASAGRSADWEKVKHVAYGRSGARGPKVKGISGIDLMTALTDIGWVPFHMTADTDPDTKENKGYKHHLYERSLAMGNRPLYAQPGVPGVRACHEFSDYDPAADSLRPTNAALLQSIRKLPLAFVAMKGAYHTSLLVRGKIYEYGRASTDLEKWSYRSTLAIAPFEDLAEAFRDPKTGQVPQGLGGCVPALAGQPPVQRR